MFSVSFIQLTSQTSSAADHWASLRANNPFSPFEPPAKAPEPAPPQLELRGILVEGKLTWFNVYNADTKESAWVQKGDAFASYAVKGFDSDREALILDHHQRPVLVALKQSKILMTGGNVRSAAALASNFGSKSVPALAIPINESQRLEQIADQIRQRREMRRRQTGQI